MEKGGLVKIGTLLVLLVALASFLFVRSTSPTGLQTFEENALPLFSGVSFTASELSPAIINLSEYFSDPEGAVLSFSTTSVGASIDGDSLTIEPNISAVELVVSDGVNTLYKLIEISGVQQTQGAESSSVVEEPVRVVSEPVKVSSEVTSRSVSASRSVQSVSDTLFDAYQLNGTFGLHTGTDFPQRIQDWSALYSGGETNDSARAALYLEGQNVTYLNIIMRVANGQNHNQTVRDFLNASMAVGSNLSILIDYEPNTTEDNVSHFNSLSEVINDVRANATSFYPNVVGISIDFEFLQGVPVADLNATMNYDREIIGNESLIFFPIWFQDDIRSAIENLSNKTNVTPLYDGAITNTTAAFQNVTNSFVNGQVAYFVSRGFDEVGVLPVSFDEGSLKKQKSMVQKTWLMYRDAVFATENITYAIFADGVALDDPLDIFVRNASVDTGVSGFTYYNDNFTISDSVYSYGFVPNESVDIPAYVVFDRSWSNGDSIPARVAGSATNVTVDNRGRFAGEVILSTSAGSYDFVVDTNGNGIYDAGVDGLDDGDLCTAGFVVSGPNDAPSIAQVILNSTDGSGETGNNATSDENLTVVIINATDPNNEPVQNITDWRLNGTSIAVLNMPFETNVSSIVVGAVRDYSQSGNNGRLGDGVAASVPVWNSSGKVGGAFIFDGSNDVINVSDSSSFDTIRSVSFWFKPNRTFSAGTASTQELFFKRQFASPNAGFLIGVQQTTGGGDVFVTNDPGVGTTRLTDVLKQ